MTDWQSHLRVGNTHYDAGNWPLAEQAYQNAIQASEMCVLANPLDSAAIQGWICGYHNLATLFEDRGDIDRARHCLAFPHSAMINQANDETLSDDIRLIASKAVKLTITPLLTFAKTHPTCEDCINRLTYQYHNSHNQHNHYH